MSEQLLTIFKLCLLVLLYLFFFRVLHAVWTEVGGTSPTWLPTGGGRRRRPSGGDHLQERPGQQPRLIVREPASHAGLAFDLVDEITIGRAAGCHITLDDTFVSQMHTRVFRHEGQFLVEDIGSTNGTYLNRQKVSAPQPAHAGDLLQVGDTVLEFT